MNLKAWSPLTSSKLPAIKYALAEESVNARMLVNDFIATLLRELDKLVLDTQEMREGKFIAACARAIDESLTLRDDLLLFLEVLLRWARCIRRDHKKAGQRLVENQNELEHGLPAERVRVLALRRTSVFIHRTVSIRGRIAGAARTV